MATYRSQKTTRLVLAALFAALAFVTALLPVPKVQGFLSFDIKDTVIVLAALLLGPEVGASLSVVVPVLESLTVGTTAVWGLVMDIISTLSIVMTASLIYKLRKTLGGAVLALVAAVAVQVATMMVANIFITPLYTGASREVVIGMLIPVLLPFNAVKSVFNAALVMLLYKPLGEVLRRSRQVREALGGSAAVPQAGYSFSKRSLLVALVSLLVLAVAALLLFLVLGASWGGAS